MNNKIITLAHGSGGVEMDELISSFNIVNRGKWENCDDDSATFDLKNNQRLVFTSDSFIVDPIFFPGGNIGHLAVCGTINDLCVMGAKPIGLSLSFVIEEGLLISELNEIMDSIKKISDETKVPIVTGDTKVMEKGKLDKIMINVSGVGLVDNNELLTKQIKVGDKIIISGGLGEHAVALLSKRFDYETTIITDSKPLVEELSLIKNKIKFARDITRGGLSAVLNEICKKQNIMMLLNEEKIPAKKEVIKVTEMLGINLYELACEGRFVCIATKENASNVITELKKFNKMAEIIGEVVDEGINEDNNNDNIRDNNQVIVQTILGKRILPRPRGRIVPRIC
jgi:hydrogenase expression/formation protein HypE